MSGCAKHSNDSNGDIAGVVHWDDTYLDWNPGVFDPHPAGVRYFSRRQWHALFSKLFQDHGLGKGGQLIEVGCGGSKYLPYFAKEFEFSVSGIDYSEHGCDLAKKNLGLAGVEGSIHFGDLFAAPKELIGTFDVAVSFGLVEHFTDTADSIAHISKLVRPGGLIFTTVPNMAGVTGMAQKLLGREIFDKHVSLSPAALGDAHVKAGLTVLDANYLEFLNFGVVNIGSAKTGRLHPLKTIVHKALLGVTLGAWSIEAILGPFSANPSTSPYAYCVAKKTE